MIFPSNDVVRLFSDVETMSCIYRVFRLILIVEYQLQKFLELLSRVFGIDVVRKKLEILQFQFWKILREQVSHPRTRSYGSERPFHF